MKQFFSHIAENVCALLLAFVLVIAATAYFGSTPKQRYDCDMKTGNAIAEVTCILQTAL